MPRSKKVAPVEVVIKVGGRTVATGRSSLPGIKSGSIPKEAVKGMVRSAALRAISGVEVDATEANVPLNLAWEENNTEEDPGA